MSYIKSLFQRLFGKKKRRSRTLRSTRCSDLDTRCHCLPMTEGRQWIALVSNLEGK
ncbi:hypothetical protein C4K18_1671 [Pseudomonas chlororaphis subsp. aurantiaca]|nr:hypothetical protein C4K18_1671 [Pseudomonas chlororaphis subsp. aurantiaca]